MNRRSFLRFLGVAPIVAATGAQAMAASSPAGVSVGELMIASMGSQPPMYGAAIGMQYALNNPIPASQIVCDEIHEVSDEFMKDAVQQCVRAAYKEIESKFGIRVITTTKAESNDSNS